MLNSLKQLLFHPYEWIDRNDATTLTKRLGMLSARALLAARTIYQIAVNTFYKKADVKKAIRRLKITLFGSRFQILFYSPNNLVIRNTILELLDKELNTIATATEIDTLSDKIQFQSLQQFVIPILDLLRERPEDPVVKLLKGKLIASIKEERSLEEIRTRCMRYQKKGHPLRKMLVLSINFSNMRCRIKNGSDSFPLSNTWKNASPVQDCSIKGI